MPLSTKVGSIFDDNVRPLLNDQVGAVFTDDVIMPYFKMAYEHLRLECEDNNIPFTNLTSDPITVVAGVTNIGGDNGPALPRDLVEIIEMYERTSGTNNDYMRMRKLNFLPKTSVLTEFLEVYTWQGQVVKLLGANSDIQVKFDYVGDSFINISGVNNQIALFNAKQFLGFRTAALCAQFIGENPDRAQVLNEEAGNALQSLESIAVKNQQNNPIRRRPFMSGYKAGNYGGNR